MELLFIAGVLWAFGTAYQHVTGQLASDRDERVKAAQEKFPNTGRARHAMNVARHDAGWAVREILLGFPVARAGWRQGWMAHRTAAVQHRAQIAAAKQNHATARQALPPRRSRMQQYRAKRAAAMAQHPASRQQQPDPEPGARHLTAVPANGNGNGSANGNGKVLPGPWGALKPSDPPAAAPAAAGAPTEGKAAAPPVQRVPDPLQAAHAAARRLSIDNPGTPVTIDRGDPSKPPANNVATYVNGARQVAAASTTATATEYSYDQTVRTANGIVQSAENIGNELENLAIPQMVDSLSGAGLDRGTLGRAADLNDAYNRAKAALKAVLDTAVAFRDQLQRDHGNVNEAHQAAPEGGAEKPFYAPS